jgi:hypothetical protein
VSGTTRNISLATSRLASDVRRQMTVFIAPTPDIDGLVDTKRE